VDPAAPLQRIAALAIFRLKQEGDVLFVTAQNLIEFWAVATRPIQSNGLGWNRERSLRELQEIRVMFPVIVETDRILEEFFSLVQNTEVAGKRTHDARLVAVMKASGIEHLLTFNLSDFAAFKGISLIDPLALNAASK
jgi:predicted nucleic acid-binding protein